MSWLKTCRDKGLVGQGAGLTEGPPSVTVPGRSPSQFRSGFSVGPRGSGV